MSTLVTGGGSRRQHSVTVSHVTCSVRCGVSLEAPLEIVGPTGHERWIMFFKGSEHPVDGKIRKLSVIPDVFHVAIPPAIALLQDGIAATVELERCNIESLAQRRVERRRCLDPPAVEEQLGVSVERE
jgi:hypothetical protein